MSHIFISHVEEEEAIAVEIARGLEEAGFRAWYYERDSDPGLSYLIQTGEAVEQSQAVIIIISQNSIKSRQVTAEVVRAHECGKSFIPILCGISHLEFQQRQPEWREAVGSATSVKIPPEGVPAILPRIIKSLKRMTSGPVEFVSDKPAPVGLTVTNDTVLNAADRERSQRTMRLFKIGAGAIIAAGLILGAVLWLSPKQTVAKPIFSSRSLQFPNIQPGLRGAMQALTITNGGTKPLRIKNVELSGGDKADFIPNAEDCLGTSMDPGDECTIKVFFNPKTAGNHTAAMSVYTEGNSQPQTISLTGTGIAPAVEVASSLTFDTREVSQSDEKSLTITNTGTAPLKINGATIKPDGMKDFVIISKACEGRPIPPGGQCALTIRFTPSSEGNRTATLAIAHNAGGEQSVALNGTATPRANAGQSSVGPSIKIRPNFDHRILTPSKVNKNQ